MNTIDRGFFDIRYLDTLAQGESWVHRLDPRSKLITTLFFTLVVVSFNKYEISSLLPFFLYPIVLMAVGNIPLGYICKKILLVLPFAVLIGIFNPFIDRSVHLFIGSIGLSGGWVSFFSILIRFTLTVGTALIFIGVTSFNGFCLALQKLRVPEIFIVQLLFLYRYLFVLMEEAIRMARARALRTFGAKGLALKTFGVLVGQLLLKTLDRAERIHLAMLSRGFNGKLHMIRPLGFSGREVFFILGWSALFLLMRFYNIPKVLGSGVLGVLS